MNFMKGTVEVGKCKDDNDNAEDKRIITVVLYIPSIEHFFCPLLQKHTPRLDAFANAGGDLSRNHPYYKVFDPCMAASLRIVRATGQPSTGGFMKEFTKVYRIQVTPRDGSMKTKDVLGAHHWPDDKIIIVPDVYAKMHYRSYPSPAKNYKYAKKFYQNLLEESSSNKTGCRKYVKHSYYKNPRQCFENAYILDSSTIKKDEQILLHVVVHSSDTNHVDEQATIRVQRLCDSSEWERCRAECLKFITRLENGKRKHPVRHEPLTQKECDEAGLPYGFDGNMFAFGKHVYQYSAGRNTYRTYDGTSDCDPNLRIMSELMSRLLSSCLHWETIGMRRILEKYDEKPPKCVGGNKGLTKSINVSVNMANAAHYDVNDEGIGVAVWIEQSPHVGMDVYFIFPNISVKDNRTNQLRNGLLIKLKDGCTISWNGNSLRHCTSMRTDPTRPLSYNPPSAQNCGLYGFHFVNNGANLRLMDDSRLHHFREQMGDGGSNINWEAFAEREYHNEDGYW